MICIKVTDGGWTGPNLTARLVKRSSFPGAAETRKAGETIIMNALASKQVLNSRISVLFLLRDPIGMAKDSCLNWAVSCVAASG